MATFQFVMREKIVRLPKKPGVYSFFAGRKLLYIGKAANIRERAKNHFQQPVYRDNLFVDQVTKIGFIETGSEIDALLLEAKLIKQHQPKYNILWRDDKNYFFVAIPKKYPPYVFITHQPFAKKEYGIQNMESGTKKEERNSKFSILNSESSHIGPFVEGAALKKTMRVLRRAFPYYTIKKHQKTRCLYCHLGLCPGPSPNAKEYKNNIRNLVSVLEGKKQTVLRALQKTMKNAAHTQDFEKAARVRDQIFALERILAHTRIIAPIKESQNIWEDTKKTLQQLTDSPAPISRIEGYDIANIQGKEATGSMVVAIDGRLDKNNYRKFKIKLSQKPNDVAMIKEVISRRLQHPEWQYPQLMLIDGGKAQLNAAIKSLNQHTLAKSVSIRVVALAKKKNELFVQGNKKSLLLKELPRPIFNLILQLRDEAHRFARIYHHKLREVDLKLEI